ncbi:MerR family transcriptional regulator [Microbacterium sp. CCNWLW134]|uniref:MerR family transcriptional regulator n=1 Tax=Microbacterium sp. CCNWLW134 TaxID=3122064 RepID=UPI00300F7E0B
MSWSSVDSVMHYSIGEFAALGRVSVRMLRHYDAIGLLVPASVDAHTGYRRYATEQLPLLIRIVELRDLGVGLDRITTLARSSEPDADLRTLLVERRAQLEASVADDRARLDRIERRLRHLNGETMSSVAYRRVEPVTVYAARTVAPGSGPEHVGPVVGPLVAQLDDALTAAGRPLIEPGIFWYEPADDHLTVSVSYIAEDHPTPGAGYDIIALPEVAEAATMIHLGELETIGESWATLMEQVVADGYRIIGPTREVYLVADGHDPGPNWVTELQAPVARRRAGG